MNLSELKNLDLNNIDFNNTGSLAMPVKALLLIILLLVISAVGYWFLWSPALDQLNQAKNKEIDLRKVFLDKKAVAINVDAYKQQMIDIQKTFGILLRQLPDKSQMDGLLTDINQAGLERGLEFELFKPGQETIGEFYAEMPIAIKVNGNYEDLGAFATDISKLSRIVTLNDISIVNTGKDLKDIHLSMEATAKTYRYLDASETSGKKTPGAKG